MLTQTQTNGFTNATIHKRRYSHLDKLDEYRQVTKREQIKNKYKQFMKSRNKSFQDCPISPQTYSQEKGKGDLGYSMPSIRTILEQKRMINQTLRQTITRYNYIRHEKQKKLQYLNRKKQKYQRVMHIREQHIKQKTMMNESRLSFLKEITQEKLRLKHSVDCDKMEADLSKSRSFSQKKQLGKFRRLEQINNKSRIKENKIKEFQSCKKLHEEVLSDEKKLKLKKQMIEKRQKKINTENYRQKLLRYLQSFAEVQQKQTKTKMQLSPKTVQLQKSTDDLDEKLRNYQLFLKDGSTLKRKVSIKPKLKFSTNRTSEKSKQFGIRLKTTSQSQDNMYYQ